MTVADTPTSLKPPVAETPWAIDNLPPFPMVVARLIQLLTSEEVEIGEVSRLISAEPVFATRVLQMANSPLFAMQQEVKTISHAIIILGLARVKAITVTRAMGDFVAPALSVKALRVCWQNTLAGALLAEKLARACGMDADFAYVAGLLRDIGRLALLAKYPESYANLLAVSREQSYDLIATERELFDIDHCEAGTFVIRKMPFPPELCEVVERHHQALNPEPFRMVNLVQIADMLADALGFEVLTPIHPRTFEEVLAGIPQGWRHNFDADPEELKTEIAWRIQTWV